MLPCVVKNYTDLLLLLKLSSTLRSGFLLGFALLQERLRDENLIMGWDRTVLG